MSYTAYRAWDLPVRLFHWINFITVLGLLIFGLLMLYKTELGITGTEQKIWLKSTHVLIGYVFIINLIFRLIWGFVSAQQARWQTIFNLKKIRAELPAYLDSLKQGRPLNYIGHNPLARLMVVVLFILLFILAISGLIRAGTDLYYPPLGNWIKSYVAASPESFSQIQPYQSTGTDADKLAAVKSFKKPIGQIHLYAAYALMLLILIHIAAVIKAEITEEGSLVSAMIHGRKFFSHPPTDQD